MNGLRVSVKNSACSSVLVKISSVKSYTPMILSKGMLSKSSRMGKRIKILLDSGATMTLCHDDLVSRKDC